MEKKQSLIIKKFIVKDYQQAEKVLDYLNGQSNVAERIYRRAVLIKQHLSECKKITNDTD